MGSHSELAVRTCGTRFGGIDALLQGGPRLQPGPDRRRRMELSDARHVQGHARRVRERETHQRSPALVAINAAMIRDAGQDRVLTP
jgi:hypothetical protein